MQRRRAACMVVSAVVSVALLTPVRAQDPQPGAAFRSGVELALLDVTVTDAEGRPVRYLTRDDFEIRVGGVPRPLATFEEAAHLPRPATHLPDDLPLDVADNRAARTDRLVVIVLDDLFFQARTEQVRDIARRLVREIGDRASLALVTTSGRYGIEPTEDRALVLLEIDRFVDRLDPLRRLAPGASYPPMRTGGLHGGPADPASFFGTMRQYKTLEDVVRQIGVDDGRRKILVWITGGTLGAVEEPVGRAAGASEGWYLAALAGVRDMLRKTRVTTYAISTRDFNAAALYKLSDESGGFVIRADDIDRGKARLLDAVDHYYVIGFYPVEAGATGYRDVDVRMKRQGLVARHRPGFQSKGRPAPPKNKDPLARIAAGVSPTGDLSLRLSAASLVRPGTVPAGVVVTMEVHAAPADGDAEARDRLRYSVWAVDLNRRKVVRSVAREATVEAVSGRLHPYQVRTVLTLQPGRYQLRASAHSARLQTSGSVYLEVDVPDAHAGMPALGGLVLGYADGSRGPVVSSAPVDALMPFAATLDREFDRAEVLRLFCTGAAGKAATDLTLSIVDRQGQVVATPFRRMLASSESHQIDVTLPLRDLPSGAYRIRVAATSPTGDAMRDVGVALK